MDNENDLEIRVQASLDELIRSGYVRDNGDGTFTLTEKGWGPANDQSSE